MLKCLCAVILVTSLGGQTIQELDEQFRAEVLEILPEDYASISMGFLSGCAKDQSLRYGRR